MPEDWDAATYDRVADPQERWGLVVLDRLPLAGGERVLDAGCGTGRVTEHLLHRLGPAGTVVALDVSPAMLTQARERLAPFGDRVSFVQADLGRPLPVPGPVDAIVSTAVFHWVLDHDALFANLAAVLRPGGALVAQCGGTGNVASVEATAAEVLGEAPVTWRFAGAEETARRLRAVGFGDVWTWLQPEPTPLRPGVELETYLATVVLRHHLEGMGPDERAAFVHEVATRLPRPEIDYVRLNLLARRREVAHV